MGAKVYTDYSVQLTDRVAFSPLFRKRGKVKIGVPLPKTQGDWWIDAYY